jgi:hypothetical protein
MVCIESHTDDCGAETGAFPTRFIDVGPMDGSVEPRLVESPGITGAYATLSHCWGIGAKPLVTETATLLQRLTSIAIDTMPKTFADAVQITRLLGIRALWIDSLCIIQDSKTDWERESACMDDVYANSVCNLGGIDGQRRVRRLLAL